MSEAQASQKAEFGYRLPDGTEHWENDDFHAPHRLNFFGGHLRLNTKGGQDQAQKRFRMHLKDAGLPEVWAKLEFIQRVVTTTISGSIPLVLDESDDDEDDLPDGF